MSLMRPNHRLRSVASMRMTLAGVIVGVPVVLVFNVLAYRTVFGKARG